MKSKKLQIALRITGLGLVLIGGVVLAGALATSPSRLAEVAEPITPDVRVFQSEAAGQNDSSTKPGSAKTKDELGAADSYKTETQSASAQKPQEKKYYILSDPNDTYYSSQWYLQTIKAPQAWATTTGSASVEVAVIDSGFALSHGDLAASWQYNSGEQGGGKESDGIDNDGNGYIDDFRGWDFFSSDNNPQAGTTNPNGTGTSHGTEVAGLVGARGNNGFGVTAVSQTVSLLPLQVLSDNGIGYSTDVADAITYAVDAGVEVINMSLGTDGDDPVVRAAVDYAVSQNVVVVAAAGNCGTSTTGICANQTAGFVTFPGSYNRVIAVGATTSTDQRASFSSYGERLDVMAPGSGTIISPTWSSTNGTTLFASSLYGTSYASPIVASSVALIRSVRPDSTVDDVRALLMAGARKPSVMNGVFYTQNYGHGVIDIAKAITVATDLSTSGEQEPELLQAGGAQSEHSFSPAEQMGSGCVGPVQTWCTVWLKSTESHSERYLAYTRIGESGKAGWTWSGAPLNRGEWLVRARQGSTVSTTPYTLFRK